jgi:serine/threonine protein kinase/tetratricopeptide (TPR) repeat protein
VVAEQLGQSIGPYKLIERIGEGGYGVVYRAEQTQPIRRFVALKIIKLGMDTRQVIARFEAERQTLALMDHPNIAKVFEAGSTEVGRPYFVMELVEGVKITDYCNEFNLSTRERLSLFVQVCRAVQHAHQKGIIHRDLKPSNILVAVQDGKPVPKVIDFGIAKATEQRLTDNTLFTAMGEFIGTPAYMSPEQAGLAGMDVDTRSDIYALGVLLYELLTGHTPFERTDLLKAGLDEMRRLIRDHEPPKPSTKLSALTAADLTAVARRHRTEPPRLLHGVRGDLDWIAMKCLEKDRARRYETASSLASDIERHLNNEPVTAAAPGNWYRLRKFVRRHRVGLAMTLALTLLLIAGIVVSTWQAVRATRAEREQVLLRRQAQAAEKTSLTEATKSRQVARFLTDMLNGVGPSVALGRDTTLLREILDKTVERVGKELQGQPDVEATLLSAIGNVYDEIGNYDKALTIHQEALRLRKAFFGATNALVADSLNDIGAVLLDQGKLPETEKLFRQSLAMRRNVLTNGHPDIATSLNNLGAVLYTEANFDEAERTHREALELRQKLYGNANEDTATSMHNLGTVLYAKNQNREAEAMFRDVESTRRKLFGETNLDLATTIANLGAVLSAEGNYPESEAKFRDALAIQRQLRGPDHKDIAMLLYNVSCALQSEGKFREAEGFCRDALAMQRKLLGPQHPDVATTLAGFASCLEAEGKFAEAEAAQREALEIQRKTFGDDNPNIAVSLNNLGDILRVEGKFAEAETETRSSLAMMRKAFGNENQFVAYPLATLANVLRDDAKLPEAEAAERETLAMRTNSLGAEHPEIAQSLNDLGVILAEQDHLTDAERLLRQALAMRRKLLGNEHPDTLDSLNGLAKVLQQQGNLTEAESLARQCNDLYEKLLPDDWRAFETSSLLGAIYLTQKKYADAEPLLIAGYDGLRLQEDRIPARDRRYLRETARYAMKLYRATSQAEKAAEWEKRLSD